MTKTVQPAATRALDKWRNEIAGKGEGISSTSKMIVAFIGAISLVMGIIAAYFAITSPSDINKNTAERLRTEQSQPAQRNP